MTRQTRASTPPGALTRRRVQTSTSERETWAWAQTHRGKAVKAPAQSVGRAASKLMKPLAAKFGPGAGELEARWPEIVGPALAAHSTPLKFQAGAGGLTLLIQAPGPAAALIEAQSTEILQRVEQFAGRAPKRLKVTQSGRPARKAIRTRPKSRILKVNRFTAEPEGLDAVMEAFEAAVTRPKAALHKHQDTTSKE